MRPLEGTAWQVYQKPGDGPSAPAETAVMLALQLGPAPELSGGAGGANREDVRIEVRPQQLDALLEGLNKVKEQLSKVVG